MLLAFGGLCDTLWIVDGFPHVPFTVAAGMFQWQQESVPVEVEFADQQWVFCNGDESLKMP